MKEEGVEGRLEKGVAKRLERYERESRYLRKRSEEYEVLEEVFDKPTLITLYRMMNAGHLDTLNGVVAAGKEARVYWGVKGERKIAVKIFLTVAQEFRKRLPYIEGDPRFPSVRVKELIPLWARKEFANLKQAHEHGIDVPEPYLVKRNILLMEFIGEDGRPAPLLAQCEVGDEDYERCVSIVKELYRSARLVHADLSEFNIFKWEGRLVLFDFGSAVDADHPRALEFLRRDLTNLNRFFSKRGYKTRELEALMEEVLGRGEL